jgi:ABC-type Na+ transport system ATPase subunit NatA
VADVRRPGVGRRDAARLEEARHCDGLVLMRDGEVLVRDSPGGLRRRTGEENLEDAFVALVHGRAGVAA